MGTHRAKSIAKELGRAQLGDERRSARLEEITQAIFDRPGVSLPRAMGGASALEAAYRFLGNEEVSLRAILEPHVAATAERVAAAAVAYCISDTTELRFGGQTRQGMGPLEHGRGVITHLALAVSVDGSRTPLGVLNVETIVRPETPKGRHGTKKSRQQADSESLKWSREFSMLTAVTSSNGGFMTWPACSRHSPAVSRTSFMRSKVPGSAQTMRPRLPAASRIWSQAARPEEGERNCSTRVRMDL